MAELEATGEAGRMIKFAGGVAPKKYIKEIVNIVKADASKYLPKNTYFEIRAKKNLLNKPNLLDTVAWYIGMEVDRKETGLISPPKKTPESYYYYGTFKT